MITVEQFVIRLLCQPYFEYLQGKLTENTLVTIMIKKLETDGEQPLHPGEREGREDVTVEDIRPC